MEANPSQFIIEDGLYAQGKKIQVTYKSQYDAISTVLKGLEFFSKIQQAGDEVTLKCQSVFTANNKLTSCQVSFLKDSDY